jgi:rhomboid protease GluP
VLALSYQWQRRLEKLKSILRGPFGGGNEQPRPKLCPACGSLVGITATRCHECGTNLRFSLAAVSKGLSGVFGGNAPVSTLLLILNLIMFGITWLVGMKLGENTGGLNILWGMNGEALYRLGMSIPFRYDDHALYRFFTAEYLHGGLLHIGMNMLVLMDIGPLVEETYGSARYFFFYTVAGLCGALLSATLSSHPSVGASGAILGMAGVLIAMTGRSSSIQMQQMRSRLISWVVTLFAIGFLFQGLRTDNWAHLGGIASGFVLGKIFADRQPLNSKERNTAYALGWLAAAAVATSFVFMILHFNRQ